MLRHLLITTLALWCAPAIAASETTMPPIDETLQLTETPPATDVSETAPLETTLVEASPDDAGAQDTQPTDEAAPVGDEAPAPETPVETEAGVVSPEGSEQPDPAAELADARTQIATLTEARASLEVEHAAAVEALRAEHAAELERVQAEVATLRQRIADKAYDDALERAKVKPQYRQDVKALLPLDNPETDQARAKLDAFLAERGDWKIAMAPTIKLEDPAPTAAAGTLGSFMTAEQIARLRGGRAI